MTLKFYIILNRIEEERKGENWGLWDREVQTLKDMQVRLLLR